MLRLTGQHLVTDLKSAQELEKRTEDLLVADYLSRTNGYPIEFGANITLYIGENNPDFESIEEITLHTFKKLEKEGIRTSTDRTKGAGNALAKILTDQSIHSGRIIGAFDMDVIKVNDLASLERIFNYAEIFKTKGLYGRAAYDFAVKLAQSDEANAIRFIHESFFALAIDKVEIVGQPRENPNPIHLEIPQITTALYLLNTGHPKYPDFLAGIAKNRRKANLGGFASYYFYPILASELGTVMSGYVNANQNKFYGNINEEEERINALNLVKSSTKELRKTDIRTKVITTIENPQSRQKISTFYEDKYPQLVAYMREIILGTLQ